MKGKDELRLARALDQLTVYLDSLKLPFTLTDLYKRAYGAGWEEMPGALWLEFLGEDPYVRSGRDEFYTLLTIFDTLHEAGLVRLLDVIARETERLGIGMGVIKPGSYTRRPPKTDSERDES
jgi:hypothetical protein